MAKTRTDRVPLLTDRVAELHSYAVPEITTLPITGGLDSYLDWIRSETGPA